MSLFINLISAGVMKSPGCLFLSIRVGLKSDKNTLKISPDEEFIGIALGPSLSMTLLPKLTIDS